MLEKTSENSDAMKWHPFHPQTSFTLYQKLGDWNTRST